LKSPTTLTRCASGAQTAKTVPATPSIAHRCAPRRSKGRRCEPSARSQTSISPKHRGEAVGIIGFLHAAVPGDPQAIGKTVATAGNLALEEAFHALDRALRKLGNLPPGLGLDDGDRVRARLQAANPQSSVSVGVHSEDRVRVAVFCPAKGDDLCMVKHLRLPYLECA
jgi:hypothetical protein